MRPTTLAAFTLAVLASAAAAQDRPVLKVMTYDSFVPDWGPGPAIEANFEAVCDCDLQFVAAGDGAALLARAQILGEDNDASVILGLDSNLIEQARATGLFAEAPGGATFDLLPVAWTDPVFRPYDWGHFAFVHRADLADVPSSFRELADSDLRIVIQDPRSSTPGLGLVMWVKAAYGEEAPAIWEALADNIVTVTPGWSEAYGLFLDGEADMVLSYTTSPSYHLIAEEDPGYAFARFDEGHYMQVEVAAKLAAAPEPELADQFLAFMATEGFQGVIPTTNWMFPVVTPEAGLPEGFAEPLPAEASLLFAPEEAAALRDAAVEEWRAALAR